MRWGIDHWPVRHVWPWHPGADLGHSGPLNTARGQRCALAAKDACSRPEVRAGKIWPVDHSMVWRYLAAAAGVVTTAILAPIAIPVLGATGAVLAGGAAAGVVGGVVGGVIAAANATASMA